MLRYRTPVVQVQQEGRAAPPIKGVSTSTLGMVGVTERRPTEATTMTSWVEYQSHFGGLIDSALSYLRYAVSGFFANIGQCLVVLRVTHKGGAAVSADNAILSSAGDSPGPAAPTLSRDSQWYMPCGEGQAA